MKQKLLKMMMLLCAMMTIGSGEVWGETWQKVTSAPSDWSGEYLIVYENSSTEGYCWTGVDAASCYATATISNGTISSKPSGAVSVTIASMADGYSVKVNGGTNNGKYIYGTSGSNTINFGSSAVANTLEYSSGVDIASNTSHFVYNSTNNQKRFRYFKSTTYSTNGYIKPHLYKKLYTLTYSTTNGSISGVVYNTSTAVASGASVAEGSQVTLTAAPSDGYRFESWSVSGTGSSLSSTTDNPTTFTMGTADATVTANFALAGNYITASPTTKEVTSAGENAAFTISTDQTLDVDPTQFYTTADGNETASKPDWITEALYVEGTLLLTVAANTGAARTAYFRVEKGSVKSGVITINQAAQTYEIDQYSSPATAHGTVTFSPSSPIDAGAEVTLTATPDDGYVFTADSWSFYKESGNDFVIDNSIKVTDNKITMPSYDLYVDATFTPIAVTGVTLDKTTASIGVGDTETLTATIAPANALNKNITWTSDNTAIATVSNGVVTGVALGSATITATTEDGSFTATCTVSVENAVTFTAGTDKGTSTSNNNTDQVTKSGVTVYSTNAALAQTEYRLYSGSKTKISVTSGKITKIEFTMNGSYASNLLSTETGTYSNGTWTGLASSVEFSASAQARVDKIKVFVATTATPTFSVAEGEYNEAKDVTISCATDGATIYYTTDGTKPTSSSSVYSSAVHITETTTLKAIAIKDEIESDGVASATYTMIPPAAPTFDVAASVFDTSFDLHLSTETDGATIYYTTDESTPTTSSTVYSTKVSIPAETTTVKAIAVKDGLTSDVSSVTYTYDARTTPTFTLSATSIDLKVNETSSAVTLTTSSDATPSFTCADAHVTLTGTGNSRTITADAAGTYTVNVSVSGSANYKDAEGTITVNVTKKATTMVLTPSFTSMDLHVTTSGSLTGAPQYNSADIAGAAVTYSSSDETVATIAADGTITFKTAGSTTLTASYAGNDEYQACEATYVLDLVDTTPRDTEVEITPNYAFYGKSSQFSGNTYDELTGENNGISITYTRNSGSAYANSTAMRFYKSNELSIKAPSGYYLTQIELTLADSYSDIVSDKNTYNASTGIWSGSANEVTFSRPSNASSYATISKIKVTIAETVTIGTAGYTTYVTKQKVRFPDGVTGYIATSKSSETITLTSMESVPVGTPIVVKAAAGTYALPAIKTTPESVSGNLLKASDGTVEGDGSTIFALGVGQAGTNEGKVGFFLVGDGVTVPAGKAYYNTSNFSDQCISQIKNYY